MRQVIRADPDLLADRTPDPAERVPAPLREARASARRAQAKTPERKPFRRRRRSGLGAGERKGRAGRSPVRRRRRPRPPRRCPARTIRPPPARCAPAWRFRAPRPPPRSCASTPTKPRCATCASPSATRSGLRRSLLALARSAPAGRPASTRAGSSTWRRRGSTSRCRKRPISTGSCELSAGA